MTIQKKSKQGQRSARPSKTDFRIPLPCLWITLLVCLLYAGSMNHGFTELDDTIFIVENQQYNEKLENITHSFKRGVFNETNDTYFRPLLLCSFVLDHQINGIKSRGHHFSNLLFHLLAVYLLYALLSMLLTDATVSFLLALIFALHPVLSQAVVWIPGRNDTLLAIFSFSFMLTGIRYIKSGKGVFMILQFIFLLGAFFTKETAVFIAPAFFILVLMTLPVNWKNKNMLILYSSWILALVIWLLVRSRATIQNDSLQFQPLVSSFFERCLLSVQYLGKILLPFNLSVFPMMEETSYVYGVIASVLLGILLYFAMNRNNKIVLGGFAFYLLMLLPAFLLPAALNNQDFEHRLYVPMAGILLVLSQTSIFKNLKTIHTFLVMSGVIVFFSFINYRHQKLFKDPLSFWTAAVESTPQSAYANMMLAARLDKTDPLRGKAMMLKAWKLNPKEKYVNFYLGKIYTDQDSIQLAERYLLEELKVSAYYETYFYLSRVAFEKKDPAKSISYMETYLDKDPGNPQAINNYVLMLLESNQIDKAKVFIQKKQSEGIPVPQELIGRMK